MFKQLSKSTKHFLRPFDDVPLKGTNEYNSLENTYLQIDVSPVKDKFICQVFEEYEKEELIRIAPNATSLVHATGTQTLVKDNITHIRTTVKHRRPPKHWDAAQFPQRFVHGHKLLSRPNTFHPIWECPTTDLSVALFMDVWPAKKITSKRAEELMGLVISREMMANIAEMRTASFFEKDSITGLSKFKPDPLSELLPYQQVAAANACMMPSYALLMDMGTGKTAVAIKKIKKVTKDCIKNNGRPAKILIVVPKSLLYNWQVELKQWLNRGTDTVRYKANILSGQNEMARIICAMGALNYDKNFVPNEDHPSYLQYREHQLANINSNQIQSVITGNGKPTSSTASDIALAAAPFFEHEALILIANYDGIVGTPSFWDKEQFAQRTEWDLIILDEAHNICNPSTDRCKAMLHLRDSATNKLVLTGTPVRNTPFDIWAIFEFLGHGYSGFDAHSQFKGFFGNWVQIPGKGISLLKSYENMAMMKERVSKYSFSITLKEAAPYLPDVTYDTRSVRMTPEQTKFYNQLVEELVAKFSHLDEDDALTVNNILTQMLRLAQITSGFAVMDQTGVHRFDPNPKLDELVDLIKEEDEPTRKFQVWSCFKESLRHIKARFDLEGISCVQYHGDMTKQEKDNSVIQFNTSRKMKCIIGTQAAGKEGLNLVGFDPQNPNDYDTNCDRAIFFSNNWSGVDRAQASKRGYRLITRVPFHITDLLVNHSIDTDIYERITGKIDMISSIRDVKKILTAAFYNRDLDE